MNGVQFLLIQVSKEIVTLIPELYVLPRNVLLYSCVPGRV